MLVTFIPFAAYAEGIFDSLGEYQKTIPSGVPTSSAPASGVKVISEATSQSPGECAESDPTSIPLKYLSNLILENNGSLKVEADNRSGKLSVSSKKFISNCSSMLKWDMRQTEIDGDKSYVVEVKIAKPDDKCKKEGCSYLVKKIVKDEVKSVDMVFEPTLKGFKQCLEKSGIVDSKGKVNPKGIYSEPLQHAWSGVKDTGRVLFSYHGLIPKPEAKYGDFVKIDKCDHYEKISPTFENVLSYEEEQQNKLREQADKLKSCSYSEYGKVADFIERYESFSGELGVILQKLMKEAAQKSAAAIAEGKFSDEDLKVIADFKKYVVVPEAENAVSISRQIGSGTGDMSQLQLQLKASQTALKSYNTKPYLQQVHVEKLIADGRFDDADTVNSAKLMAQHYSTIGNKLNGKVITAEDVNKEIEKDARLFGKYVNQQKDFYAVKTGQETGRVAGYKKTIQQIRKDIEKRTISYRNAIQEIVQFAQTRCMTNYGSNAQVCINQAQEDVADLSQRLSVLNQADEKLIAEYEEKVKLYEPYEAQYRRDVAAQNGEKVVDEPKEDTTVAPQNRNDYSFNFQQNMNGQQQMPQQQWMNQQQGQMPSWMNQQQIMPNYQNNLFQNQSSPYTTNWQQQQQQPWLAGQTYSQFGYQQNPAYRNYTNYSGGPYAFNWSNGGMNQQQMQMPMNNNGYWGNPSGAYTNNSMFSYGMFR